MAPGRDFLDGRRGREDVLLAGPGRDRLIGGSVLKGGGGNDRLDSAGYRRENGADRLDGGSGDDRLRGDSQNGPGERSTAAPATTTCSGLDGDDALAGGDGNDELDGGTGTDCCAQGPGERRGNRLRVAGRPGCSRPSGDDLDRIAIASASRAVSPPRARPRARRSRPRAARGRASRVVRFCSIRPGHISARTQRRRRFLPAHLITS